MFHSARTANRRDTMLRLKLGSTMLSFVIAGTLILSFVPHP